MILCFLFLLFVHANCQFSLSDCWETANKFANTCDQTLGAVTDWNSADWESEMSCYGVNRCVSDDPNGDTIAATTECLFTRKLCVTCREDSSTNTVYIRVQSNGLPAHCYYAQVFNPVAQEIDFEAEYNPPVDTSSPRYTLDSQTEVDDLLCDQGNMANVPNDLEYTNYGTAIPTMSAVALDGVPILNPIAAAGGEVVFPPYDNVKRMDGCLAHPTAKKGIYHYHVGPLCAIDDTVDPTNTCVTPDCNPIDRFMAVFENYKYDNKVLAVARDGRLLYAPYRDGVEIADTDACGGRPVDGCTVTGTAVEYGYFAAQTFPYLLGCYGSANYPSYTATQCSENTRAYTCSADVDGAWSTWSEWGDCGGVCPSGDGTRTRTRTCTVPPPAGAGADCAGDDTESEDCTVTCTAPSGTPNIIQIVVDDMGAGDLGFYNNYKTSTPNLNNMIDKGIRLSDYYSWNLCAPSRAAMLTGRYPWRVGYYANTGALAISQDYDLLPSTLKGFSYDTHALGKWHLGYRTADFTPTYRGFDTFAGYYDSSTVGYWEHKWVKQPGTCSDTKDIHKDENGILGEWTNAEGTYSSELLTTEAISIVEAKNTSSAPFYMYLAYQNVHDGKCGTNEDDCLEAPCTTMDNQDTIPGDHRKAMAAMIAKLDEDIGTLVSTIESASLANPTIILFMSDNGASDQGSNAPYRGGKSNFWEGGIRLPSFIWSTSTTYIPTALQGTEWSGMAHSSDWYTTIVEGFLGETMPTTGPTDMDGFNLWPSLYNSQESPRDTIIHQIWNSYMANSMDYTDDRVISARVGNYKYIEGDNTGDAAYFEWPDLATSSSFSGTRDDTTDQCWATLGDDVTRVNIDCSAGCLFDLSEDKEETTNLISYSEYSTLVTEIQQLLDDAATETENLGIDWAEDCSRISLGQLCGGDVMMPSETWCDVTACASGEFYCETDNTCNTDCTGCTSRTVASGDGVNCVGPTEMCVDVTGINFGTVTQTLGYRVLDGSCQEITGATVRANNQGIYDFYQTLAECQTECESGSNLQDSGAVLGLPTITVGTGANWTPRPLKSKTTLVVPIIAIVAAIVLVGSLMLVWRWKQRKAHYERMASAAAAAGAVQDKAALGTV